MCCEGEIVRITLVGSSLQWTTDADIFDAVKDIGVKDLLEVKFFENRSNGQSKGFCSVYVGSESSSRIVVDKLAQREINGVAPAVAYPTKQALAQVRYTLYYLFFYCYFREKNCEINRCILKELI